MADYLTMTAPKLLNDDGRSPIRGEEIASLRKLETLQASFHDLNDFNAYVNSWKDWGPTNYSLCVGNRRFFIEDKNFKFISGNCLYVFDDESVSKGVEHTVVLPIHIKSLTIEKINHVEIMTILCDQRAIGLRMLDITSCDSMKHLLPCSCFSVPAFQSLESLFLEGLKNLSDLVEVKISASSALHSANFSCLKGITISFCQEIKRLFTPALVINLQNLESLDVRYCYKMVEIIGPSDELDAQESSSSILSTLPNLCRLVYNLPELKIFCSNIKMNFPSLSEDINIKYCPKLKRIPPLPPLPPSEEEGPTSSINFLEGIEIQGTERAKYTEECAELKRFPPLPPLPPSKEAAGSASTISLEGIDMDEEERTKWLTL